MAKYAERTKVPVSRSREEIERILDRYGAEQFAYMRTPTITKIGFSIDGRMIRVELPLSDQSGNPMNDQEIRAAWRALVLIIKAKLEAVDSGIVTLEDEFLAHMVMRDGRTVGEVLRPQLAARINGEIPLIESKGV